MNDGQTTVAPVNGESVNERTDVTSEQTGFTAGTTEAADTHRPSALSTAEQSDLKRLVGRFQKLQGAWYEGLNILLQIRQRRLFRQDHPDFETFCREVFGMGKSNVNRSIQSAEVAMRLATIVAKPRHESHIRPLLQLNDADQQVECFQSALETARIQNRAVKASDVAAAVRVKLQPSTSVLDAPAKPMAVEVMKRITRSLLQGLDKQSLEVLTRFEGDLVRFKRDWFDGNVGFPQTPAVIVAAGDQTDSDTGDENKQTIVVTSPAGVTASRENVSTDDQAWSQAELSGQSAGPAPVPRSAPENSLGPKIFDHALTPGRRSDAIALELAPGVRLEEIRSLNLHRHMENRCHVFLKSEENPAGISAQAVANNTTWAAGKFTLATRASSAPPADGHADTDTIVLLVNGYGQERDQFEIEPVYVVEDLACWFNAILQTPDGMFPKGHPSKVLFMKVAPATSGGPTPENAGDRDANHSDTARSTEQGAYMGQEEQDNADE